MPISHEDFEAIQALHHRYYLATDDADVDRFMDCWADDRPVAFESVFGDFDTRDALRDFEHEHTHTGMAVGKRHVNVNLVLREGDDPDTVYATSYMLVFDVVNPPRLVATGKYTDSRVVRTKDGWRFDHRKLDVDPGYQKLQEQEGD